ncbi:MAG: IPT/TIG domain-containing protein [Acidobacteriota bacterium]
MKARRVAGLGRSILLMLALSGGLVSQAAVLHSDGTAVDLQAKHDAASSGDTITVPAGTFAWSTPVSLSKAITLIGAGSGRIIGDTKSMVAVGTGSKTFTTTRSGLPISPGQVLRIAKMPHPPGGGGEESFPSARGTYMEGTVTSYAGSTLVMNITTTGGSGTWTFWWIATKPATTVVNSYDNGAGNNNAATPLIRVTQNQVGSTEIAGIKFVNSAIGNSATIGIDADAYTGPKTLIHDCWFQASSARVAIYVSSNRGLVWNCSFDDVFSQAAGAFQFKWEFSYGDVSWSTDSTMGDADTNGATNFYVEDCDFHAYLNAFDVDSNGRVVVRHSLLDNSGMSSHGADTGPIGLRHLEVYDNELVFDNFGEFDGSVTLPVPWFLWLRGGTCVVTDNILPAISSSSWGNKANVTFSVLNIRRDAGGYPCWTSYPAPHQVGQGYGPGAVFHTYFSEQFGELDYYTYLEPAYIWNNSGTGGNTASLNAETDDPCGNNQMLSDYVQADRDYYSGVAKPGYQKYTFPHPLHVDLPDQLTVTDLSPTSGSSAGGDALTITGTAFAVGTNLTIGGTPAADVTVLNAGQMTASSPAVAPGRLNDLVVTQTNGNMASLASGWLSDFLDVPSDFLFHHSVEVLFRNGVTAGCLDGFFCPEASVTRSQMAVFLLKSKFGSTHEPPPGTGTVFDDVAAGDFAAAWIEELSAIGVTAGCGGGSYCPDQAVTRAEMAVFLLKTALGSGYTPPAAVDGTFDDVHPGDFAADWIEDLFARGVTAGCQDSPPLFCPDDPTARGQMAVFLVKTFGLE